MSRKDAVLLASRTLAALLIVWALSDLSYLPERLNSFLRYSSQEPISTIAVQYWRHNSLLALGFLITRIIGFSLMAMWLRKGGPEVEELLLPPGSEENTGRN
jgi:hypothetical protein